MVHCNSTVVLTASDHNGARLAGDLLPTTTPGAWLYLSPTSKEKGKNGAALESPTTVIVLKPRLENFEHTLLACEMNAIMW